MRPSGCGIRLMRPRLIRSRLIRSRRMQIDRRLAAMAAYGFVSGLPLPLSGFTLPAVAVR